MTRRLIALTVGVLGLAVAPVVANATHSAGDRPKKDLAVGTGHFEGIGPLGPTDITMHVKAKSGPSGEDARGRFFVHRELPSKLDLKGEVTCLRIEGNRAVVGGRIERSRVPNAQFPEGGGIVIQVDDNDDGPVGTDLMQGGPTATPPTVCPQPVGPARLPVQQGNFIVHDYTP